MSGNSTNTLSSLATPTPNKASTIYLIRHGDRYDYANKDWKEKILLCGGLYVDPPLSPIGHEQARETAIKLKDVKVDAILASPYLRTIQTAVPFAEQKGLPIALEHGLAEVHHIPDILPDASNRYLYFPHIDTNYISMAMPMASKEKIHEYYNKPQEVYPDGYFERIVRFSEVLQNRGFGKTVFCFSHAASVALVAALLKCNFEDIPGDDNCIINDRTDLFAPLGVYTLTRHGNGPWKLITNGSTNKHLSRTDPNTFAWGHSEKSCDSWRKFYRVLTL